MVRLPSLNALRAFVSVAHSHSVIAAANELFVTPSAVSHQLKRLEEELEVDLFVRSGKGLALTPEGQNYFEQLREVFDRIEVATARVRKKKEDRVVTVTTVPVFAIKWLVKRLADFHTQYPDIEVRLGTSYKTFDLNVSGHDLGIRWGSGRWQGMHSVKLMSEVVQPVCSPGFLAANGPMTAEKKELSSRLIHMDASRDEWRLWFSLNGWTYPESPVSMCFSEPTSAIQAAIDGLGIALGPHALVDDDLKSGRLIPAHQRTIEMHQAYYMVFPSKTGLSKAATVFADWIRARCSEHEAKTTQADICILPM